MRCSSRMHLHADNMGKTLLSSRSRRCGLAEGEDGVNVRVDYATPRSSQQTRIKLAATATTLSRVRGNSPYLANADMSLNMNVP